MVESQHSSFKKWLNTSTSLVDTLLETYHCAMEGRIIKVNQPTDYDCDCVISSTHGIPCHCMLSFLEGEGDDLMPYHVHGFWRSFEYYKPPEVDKWEDHDAADRNALQGMVQPICYRGGPSVWALSRLIRSEFQPESEGLKDPKESDAAKGRPRKKAPARDPSWFEHEGVPTRPIKYTLSTSMGMVIVGFDPCPTPFTPLYNWDLSGYATLHNRAFVVFGKWGPNRVPYGETFGVTYLVSMGRHWVVLDLADVDEFLPISKTSLLWTNWAAWETKEAWVNLSAVERNL
ncbi:hypothetical protein LINGRAHAP2_LOCUS30900 [Linum grandiflorum]